VLIQVPFHTTRADIDRFLDEKKQWLQQKIIQQQRNNEQMKRTFVPGERFPYRGELYTLKVAEREDPDNALSFTGQEFVLRRDALKGVRVLLYLWYQKQARLHLEARVNHFSRLLGIFPGEIAVGNARRRWGSCSPDNRLIFAWRLIMAPSAVIDYVVVHELCHVKIRNHSRDYWRLVEEILPGYEQQAAWLKDQGHLLML